MVVPSVSMHAFSSCLDWVMLHPWHPPAVHWQRLFGQSPLRACIFVWPCGHDGAVHVASTCSAPAAAICQSPCSKPATSSCKAAERRLQLLWKSMTPGTWTEDRPVVKIGNLVPSTVLQQPAWPGASAPARGGGSSSTPAAPPSAGPHGGPH
eukprot:246807-Chlamydomonas_euryale.AAC.6